MDKNPFSLATNEKDSNPFAVHNPTEATAAVQAISAGAVPNDLAKAKAELGKKEFIGYCQAFVEHMGGKTIAPSAVEAWNQNVDNGVARGDLNGIQPGDQVYFAPDASNHGYGHVGIFSGNNKFISATDNGIEERDLNDWTTTTGQTPIGYVSRTEALQ